MIRYRLEQTESCDWVLIPVERKKDWLNHIKTDEYNESGDIPDWAEYIDIHVLSFTDPR